MSVNVSGPTSAQVGAQVQFSANASVTGYSITGYSWTYGDGGTDTGANVSHTYTTKGSYTVRVTATSSCGNTGTGSMVIEVGGGGGGNLAITPSPATANTGQNVTFTFSPKITVQGDSVNFNFGDGNTQNVIYSSFCQIGGGCNTVTHSYVSPGTYTVTGSGVAGGGSVSGSTSVTVINNCQLTSAPTAVFTWTPPQPQVGQVVQFTDQSTGGPTSWAWSFGVSGSGTSLTAVATEALSNLSITPAPANPAVGQKVTFTFAPGVQVVGDVVTFDFKDGTQGSVPYNSMFCSRTSPCTTIGHTYTVGGTFAVSATGTAGGASVSGSTSVTVTGSSTGLLRVTPTPSNPTVNQTVTFTFSPALTQTGDSITFSFGDTSQQTISYSAGNCGAGGCSVITHSYAAAGPYSVVGTGTAGGLAVSGGTSVTVTSGGGGGGTSTLQNPTYAFAAPGTYTVTLVSTNCKGSSQLQRQIIVCNQTAVPTANFTWGPTGTLAGFPEQQQPFASEQVTLTDTSTNAPFSWSWYDFGDLALPPTTVTVPTFNATWTTSGDKSVSMKATNCVGTSAEVVQVVHVYPDVRHVVPDFSWSPDAIGIGAAVTFTAAQDSSSGNPDTFVWTFDDTKGTVTGSSVTHAYTCGGSHSVTLTASRADYPSGAATVTKHLTVNGTPCGPESVMTVDAADLKGLNGTHWQTDVRIFNPAPDPSTITIYFLPVGQDNSTPAFEGLTLQPKAIWSIDNVIDWANNKLGTSYTKAALRFTYDNPDTMAPMIVSRTYTQVQGGGTYGQLATGINVVRGTTGSPLWITGLRNNGLQEGFRTNYSLLNLVGDGGVGNITFTLYDVAGTARKSVTQGLYPLGYIQDSIKNLFGTGYDTIGTFSLKIDVPSGANVQAYASVVDNQTGAPVLIPAGPSADLPIYLPGVAHTSGKNGTVWRSDMQLTNPDSVAHTWKVTYTPRPSDGFSVQTRSTTIAPQASLLTNDAVTWAFSGNLADSAKTSGVLKIKPSDGTGVYPIVQARSFNETANGTFGQNISPLTGDQGISVASASTRLLLTGMSTTDTGFRTNFGFVNLSETSSVVFEVYFYDENGNVLNPKGADNKSIPYTLSLGVDGWDQDQLENRFTNAGWPALPANLRAISAEIFVTGGGPGTVYATVIDNLTGDPIFIPAQPAP